ncbi:DNA cytosine methyltransferase [Acinetobacter pittii]|uniref:DNA cytosine methyltransferase n=1 Tax=Acinetobacter pittii TaxID=48296 RepID=UPI00300C5FF8
MEQLSIDLENTNDFSRYKQSTKLKKALCLFSSAGIGELGVISSGIEIVLANELLPERVKLYKENFKTDNIIEGDIWELQDRIVSKTNKLLRNDGLFLVYATPPCQGMSTNGMGKLKSEIEKGKRSEEDKRNRLIIPTLNIVKQLKPEWVLFENVPAMKNTEIRLDDNSYMNIIEYIRQELGNDYEGCAEVVACEDHGIPQKRKRLITIFTKNNKAKEWFKLNENTFFPLEMKEKKITLRDAIENLPPLDASEGKNKNTEFNKYHFVPIMNPRKYWWISNTKEGTTAFNNQCVSCGYTGTPGHKDILVDGKWIASKDTPIYCDNCNALLPRPTVLDKSGNHRPLKGFHSAYRRMKWDEPARTLTQNFIYEASDNKVHPSQNRVLSIYEAMILQTIDKYSYDFEIDGKILSAAKIAEVIGESVPPYLIEKICRLMISFD